MKNKSISRILMVVTLMVVIPMTIVCVVLTLGTSAVAQSGAGGPGSGGCSNRTLFGNYGSQIEGTILGPNLPLRGLFMAHYDGEGNLTLVDHIVINGVPPLPAEEWRPGSGTYAVNPDCTGSAVINTANPPIPLHFVVVNHGREIHEVVDADAITVVAHRVD
jgi:hypothetical protein